MNEDNLLEKIKNIKSEETYTLPSKGYVYTEADGIPASITLRRMTTKEDKIRLRNESEDRIRKDLLQACIITPNVNAGKLKLADANFLLFRLRSLSLLDDTYKIGVRCPNCGTEFIHEINLLDVPIKFMTKENMKKLSVTLPISQTKIDLHYPNINDIIKISDALKDYTDKFGIEKSAEYLYTLSAILYVDRVNGHTLMREEMEQYIDNLDILDSRELSTAINSLDSCYGFDEILGAKCPTCGDEVKHGLPITSELFTPSK